jgi:quercetin dioxygenase-like cupin family protein
MNRREFAGFAAIAPLIAAAQERRVKAAETPLVLGPERARVYTIGHGEARILVGAEQSKGAWWLGTISSDPERKTSLRLHHSMDEQVYVLDGVLSAWLDGHWQELPTGGLVVVPHGVPHALGNRTQRPMRYLGAGNPAGFEKFFADIEIAARNHPYSSPEFLTDLKNIYTKYDSKLVGPPPEG